MASERMERRRGEAVAKIILILSVLAASCQCAPSFNPKPSWREDNGVPILTPSCNPATGRCWSWLPLVNSRPDDYVVEQDFEYDRAQPIHVRDVEQDGGWQQQPVYGEPVADGARSMMGPMAGGQLTKKDFAKKEFVSRGWNAGGLPFSVLYLVPRKNQEEEAKAEAARRNGEAVGAPAVAPVRTAPRPTQQQGGNYRLSPRNGSPQSRRNYSIIPQLFISYGWGPSGK